MQGGADTCWQRTVFSRGSSPTSTLVSTTQLFTSFCCAFQLHLSVSCSAGIGQIDHRHLHKADGELGMLVVKIGGPAYRIGMGGGAASSVPSGSNKADLDFNAVQVGLRLKRESQCWTGVFVARKRVDKFVTSVVCNGEHWCA